MKDKIYRLFHKYDSHKIYSSCDFNEAAKLLKFDDAIKLAWKLLFQEFYFEDDANYGMNLLLSLKEQRPSEWDSDWRHEALLGAACCRLYRYHEGFAALSKAYHNQGNDNQGLWIRLADCYHAPGPYDITYHACLELAHQAMQQGPYVDGACALCGIYAAQGDEANYREWKDKAISLKVEGASYSPHIFPHCLEKEEIEIDSFRVSGIPSIEQLFLSNQLDEIFKFYTFDEAAILLSFESVVKLAWKMLYQDFSNASQSEFGVRLLMSLRTRQSRRWTSDWHNDAFLGQVCFDTYRHDYGFEAFDRAYYNGGKNHPGLLMFFYRSYHSPGPPFFSPKEYLRLVQQAMQEEVYVDGARALCNLYLDIGDKDAHEKWKAVAEKLEAEGGRESPDVYPHFL